MKARLLKKIGTAGICSLLALGAATAAHAVETDSTVSEIPGGALAVDTVRATVVLTAIDKETREIAFQTEEGLTETFTAGPGVANFDQLAVGDRVTLTFKEATAVFLGSAEVPSADAGVGVARAPIGATPGGTVVGTAQITAKVLELDKETRHAKLELPGGVLRSVKVRDGIDLTKVTVGDSVTIAIVQGLAIEVEKP